MGWASHMSDDSVLDGGRQRVLQGIAEPPSVGGVGGLADSGIVCAEELKVGALANVGDDL